MILQALKEYYDRKANDPNSEIAPLGWEHKEIPYIIVLDKEGNPTDLQSTVEGTGKNKTIKKFLVPQGVKRTSGVASNLLWDNPEYILGVSIKDSTKKKEGQSSGGEQKHNAFRNRLEEIDAPDDTGFNAVKQFAAFSLEEKLAKLKDFPETKSLLQDVSANVTFKLAGETGIVTDSESIKQAINKLKQTNTHSEESEICLVTGTREPIETLHPAIKGVWGGNTTGTSIVSFNLDAFCSFAKKQGANAPIGKTAAFAYTTALNTLLDKNSQNRMQVGEASTIFWSEKSSKLEQRFSSYFGEPPKDDPDRGVKAVKELFESVQKGDFNHSEGENRFYVLGLSPNAARVSIRFWIVGTVGEMEGRIAQFFRDTEIVHSPKQAERLSLFRLLTSTALEGKSENIPPNLEGDFMRAILEGTPYPSTLLTAAVRRARAEHEVTYQRAALIKACLNRLNNITATHNPKMEEITVTLNKENKNIGYRLGRLFAVLEKIQEKATPGLNATIRDRYYGAASGTPITVFPNLIRLDNHHLSKLENEGLRIYFNSLLGEIISEIQNFPNNLSMAEQGQFAIGYYHQRHDFFSKKPDKEN